MSTEILLWGVVVYVVATLLAVVVALRVLLALPPTYFTKSVPPVAKRSTSSAIARRIARNALGVVLIAIGVLLSVPGVPGQGLLTILVGVMLLDFPGRPRVERRIIGRPSVLAGINRLRGCFGRPPIIAVTADTESNAER